MSADQEDDMIEQHERRPRFSARRQRRIAQRRQEIMAAAARVFAEKGYANTTTREIADEVDMAEGTLYNYFDGKREVLLAIFSDAEALIETILLEGEKLEGREAMIEMFERGLSISESRLPFTRILLTEAMVDDSVLQEFVWDLLQRTHRRLEMYITERIAAGAFRAIDPGLCARAALGMFFGIIAPIIRGIQPPPSPEQRRVLAVTAVDLLLDGLRARDGA
jgi:TetR/AcrR family fatty acid metabolism transcriptional regulator